MCKYYWYEDYNIWISLENFQDKDSRISMLTKTLGISEKESEEKPGFKVTIRWISLNDLFHHDTFREESDGNSDENKVHQNTVYIHLTSLNVLDASISKHFFRSLRYLNGSIWHYLYSFEQLYNENGKENYGLREIIEEISLNYHSHRYDLAVAEEYRDLQIRLFAQDYLKGVNGHANFVAPFLFHSEREISLKLEEEAKLKEKKKEELFLHDCNWRVLLVDDHYKTNMASSESNQKTVLLNKYGIIKSDVGLVNIKARLSHEASQKKAIEFDCVSSVEEAFKKLKDGNKYDIILLDYKLDVQNGRQEYGYELLERIRDDQEGKNGQAAKKELVPAPNETFYFMFISAYTTAVQERLQMEGFYLSKDYWFIGRGACPTNTPYLFLYSLKRMMDIRYDKLTKHSKQLLKDLNKRNNTLSVQQIEADKGKYATMTMFLTKLYEKDKERNNCVLGFNAFLNLRRVYDTIKHDVNHDETLGEEDRRMKSSPLIMSLFKDEKYCSNSFWEHLQNLVYLTAFGTIRQWPEMWEDYMFIKTKLEKAEDEIWKVLSEDEKKNNAKPSFLIRNYILNLKGMMS